MLAKVNALLNLFRKGKMVANPAAWKNGQITVSMLSALILAMVTAAQVFGSTYPAILPVVSLLQTHAVGIAGIVVLINGMLNPIATVVSSEKIGLRAKPESGKAATTTRNPLDGSKS